MSTQINNTGIQAQEAQEKLKAGEVVDILAQGVTMGIRGVSIASAGCAAISHVVAKELNMPFTTHLAGSLYNSAADTITTGLLVAGVAGVLRCSFKAAATDTSPKRRALFTAAALTTAVAIAAGVVMNEINKKDEPTAPATPSLIMT